MSPTSGNLCRPVLLPSSWFASESRPTAPSAQTLTLLAAASSSLLKIHLLFVRVTVARYPGSSLDLVSARASNFDFDDTQKFQNKDSDRAYRTFQPVCYLITCNVPVSRLLSSSSYLSDHPTMKAVPNGILMKRSAPTAHYDRPLRSFRKYYYHPTRWYASSLGVSDLALLKCVSFLAGGHFRTCPSPVAKASSVFLFMNAGSFLFCLLRSICHTNEAF